MCKTFTDSKLQPVVYYMCSHYQKSQNLLTNVMIITLSLLIPQYSAIHYHHHHHLLCINCCSSCKNNCKQKTTTYTNQTKPHITVRIISLVSQGSPCWSVSCRSRLAEYSRTGFRLRALVFVDARWFSAGHVVDSGDSSARVT